MKTNVSTLLKETKKMVGKHSPEILTGLGIAGMITTTVLAVKATPKALKLIEEAQAESDESLTNVEKVKAGWKPYIPAAVSMTFSTACLIGASSVNAKRNAALATAYKLSEEAFTIYKDKVVETIGEKKEQQVRDKVKKEIIERNPVSSKEVIVTEKGNTLCYDAITGRYFKSDIEAIKKAVNEINRRMLQENYMSMNDLFYEIGLEQTRLGDELGWNLDDGLVEVDFGSQIAEDGTPCIVLDYRIAPKYDFSRNW